jgi:hypothetical protein
MTDFLVDRLKAVEILAAVDGLETTQAAIEAAVEALTKQTESTPVDNITFDDDPTSYTSAEIDCTGYRKFMLRMILGVTLAPTTIKINVQFSHGGATYENYVQVPFGSLMYEDTAGAKSECIAGECLAPKMKINVVAVGTDATNKFTLTCKVILTR